MTDPTAERKLGKTLHPNRLLTSDITPGTVSCPGGASGDAPQ